MQFQDFYRGHAPGQAGNLPGKHAPVHACQTRAGRSYAYQAALEAAKVQTFKGGLKRTNIKNTTTPASSQKLDMIAAPTSSLLNTRSAQRR